MPSSLKIYFRHIFCWVAIACLLNIPVFSQSVNLGIPPIWNFSKKEYKAGTQNWDAAQDSRGVLYFANNEGLLQFDGNNWSCHPVTNKTVVRSVAIDVSGRIFVGAQSELGYFFPTQNGVLAYHSLVHLLPKGKRDFEDIWDIAFSEGNVFFRTNQHVFQYNNSEIKIHTFGGSLTAMFSTPQGLMVQQNLTQLLRFENNAFQLAYQIPELKSALTGAVPVRGDTLLFCSLKDGLFCLVNGQISPWKTQNDALIKGKRIYTATALENGQLALGTSLSGLLVLDQQRRARLHLTKNNGLQNNNILCSLADRAGNLWLGLDSGIDCAILDAPYSTIVPDGMLQGTGYAAAVFENQLYLGVSSGVYAAPWKQFYNPDNESHFKKIPYTDGQVWSLQNVNGELLMGHHEGTFRLNNNGCTQVATEPGAWKFVQVAPDYMFGGHYSGIVLYHKVGGRWIFDQKLNGLAESCRIMVKDADGAVWVAHPYRGLFRIEWSPERKSEIKVQTFNAKNGLPSDLNNLVFTIAGKTVISTEKGILRYDAANAAFIQDEDFNRYFNACGRIRYLQEDLKGNIWYVGDKETGVLQVSDFGLKKTVQKRVFPELGAKLVGGFEFIYPVDEENIFFGAEQGFIHYNASAKSGSDTVLQVVFHNISANGKQDSTLLGGWFAHNNQMSATQQEDDVPILDADNNNLHFSFSATDYKDPASLKYRVKLIGLSSAWSEWSPEPTRNFMTLSPGHYTFQVQARRKDGRESEIISFSFRIRPPWYASTFAFVFYALCLVGGFMGSIMRQQKKFESEKEQLTVQHQQMAAEQQREVEESKAAMNEIQNEKLEAEIRFKNQELASATMHLVQKGEILLTVQENLTQILEKSTSPDVKREIQQLLNLLNFDTQLDEDWEQFAFHFDQVHVNFLKQLREKFPQLGSNDLKLCAYLRMNLTTKEIAPLLNISVRGIEASRYRLRKKLGLPNDANLTDFMMRI